MAETSGAASVGAVTFNRPAIDQATGGGSTPKPPVDPVAAKNAIAALRLGWALEELVARTRLIPTRGYYRVPPVPEFPPDLTHQLGPVEQLKLLWKLLQVEEKALLTAVADPSSPPAALPSAGLGLDAKITALITATNKGTNFPDLLTDMDTTVLRWNEQLVATLIDPLAENASTPANAAILTSYEVGKALSRTRWYIWVNTPYDHGGAATAAASDSDAWNSMFKGNRIGNIRRHLDGLANTVDAKTVTTVSTNLEYWHNALHNLDEILSPPDDEDQAGRRRRHDSKPSGRGTVAAWPRGLSVRNQPDINVVLKGKGKGGVDLDEGPRLLLALEEQMDNWYDLLTGRRRPEDFPITGIITDLLNELGKETQAAWPRFIRHVLAPLIVPGIIFVLILIAAVVVLGMLTQGGNASPLAGGLAGLSAGLAALVALAMGRGTTLVNQGSADVSALQARVNQLEADAREKGAQATQATQALPGPAQNVAQQAEQSLSHFSWQKLMQNALSDVEQQIKIEELNLAISEPLVRYVLAPRSAAAAADPAAAARRFLELIYSGTSNVERLENVFSNLYRQTFSSTTGLGG